MLFDFWQDGVWDANPKERKCKMTLFQWAKFLNNTHSTLNYTAFQLVPHIKPNSAEEDY